MKFVTGLSAAALLVLSSLTTIGCDPQECKELKAQVCETCGAEHKACTDLAARSGSAENCTAISGSLATMKQDVKKKADGNAEIEAQAIKAFCDKIAAEAAPPAE